MRVPVNRWASRGQSADPGTGRVLGRWSAVGWGSGAVVVSRCAPGRCSAPSQPVPGQPVHVLLDLRADPRRPDPIHGLGLME